LGVGRADMVTGVGDMVAPMVSDGRYEPETDGVGRWRVSLGLNGRGRPVWTLFEQLNDN